MKRTTQVRVQAADNPLAQFEAESDAAESVPAPAASAPGRPLALEIVLTRGVPVFWPEAVAVVEATCAQLIEEDGTEHPVPSPSDILITADGDLSVRRVGGRGEPVQRLARTLHGLTAGQALPAPLRLFVTKWIDAAEGHTLAEFAKELAYFARPDGQGLIRELYERTANTAPPKATPKPEAAAAPAQSPDAKKRRQRARKAPAIILVAVLGLVTVLGVGALQRTDAGGGNSSELLASLVQRATEFARSLGEMRGEVGDVKAQLSAHLNSSADEAGTASAGDANRSRPLANPAPSRPARTETAGRPVVAPVSPSSVSVLALGPMPVPVAPADSRPAPPTAPLSRAAAAFAAAAAMRAPASGIIYSSADEGVDPPRMLQPQLPPGPLILGNVDDERNVMELIVGDDGYVERVKLLTPARRMTDMMLLSGAKAWKFAPASKDGQTVRYRLALSWAAAP